jgi:hypothetical protein
LLWGSSIKPSVRNLVKVRLTALTASMVSPEAP